MAGPWLVGHAGLVRVEAWRDRRSALVAKALGRLSAGEVRSLRAALPALRRLIEELRT